MPIPALLLLLVMVGAARHSDAAVVRTNPTDVAAMQSIAKKIGADKALGWGVKSSDPCDGTWTGVLCNTEGSVTSIKASRSGLVGRPPGAELSKLFSLTDIDLSFNKFSGALPLLPTPIRSLRNLDLRSNSFYEIPDGFFAAFPALQTFVVDNNAMISPRTPEDIRKCPDLREFSANNINVFDRFPDYFGNTTLFPVLKSLSLAGNRLTGRVPPGFGKNSKINNLNIGSQHDDRGRGLTGHIDLFLSGMENLVDVRLDHNAFFGPPPDASKLVNLRLFDAANNDLCGVPNFANNVVVNVTGNPKVGTACPP